MTIEKFIELVENHNDIMMHIGSFRFVIMTCFDDLLICEQGTKDEHNYKTVDELMEKYTINGKPIGKQIEHIILDSCS